MTTTKEVMVGYEDYYTMDELKEAVSNVTYIDKYLIKEFDGVEYIEAVDYEYIIEVDKAIGTVKEHRNLLTKEEVEEVEEWGADGQEYGYIILAETLVSRHTELVDEKARLLERLAEIENQLKK